MYENYRHFSRVATSVNSGDNSKKIYTWNLNLILKNTSNMLPLKLNNFIPENVYFAKLQLPVETNLIQLPR